MAATDQIIARFRGTLQSLVRIVDVQIKRESATVLSARNSADSAYANFRGADATTNDDFVTYRQVQGIAGSIRIPVTATAGTFTSTAQLPAGSTIWSCFVQIDTVYNGSATISVGTPTSASKFQTTSNNVPSSANAYVLDQLTAQASAESVRVTLGGTPTLGAATVVVYFTTPAT